MRVLLTGSRTWTDRDAIRDRLDGLLALHGELTVVHGAASSGTDRHVSVWCADAQDAGNPVVEECHPADWRSNVRGAGMIRNRQMAARGADLCLAFIRDESRGATHCASVAQKAGIPTEIMRWES